MAPKKIEEGWTAAELRKATAVTRPREQILMATDVKSSPSICCKFTSEPAKSLVNHESSRLTRCANLVELTESCKVAAAYSITKFGFDTAENEPS